MTRQAKIILPVLILILGAGVGAAIFKAKPKVEREAAIALPPLVRVMATETTDLALTVKAQGTVAPRVDSSLVTQVAGRLDWVSRSFAEGGFFRAGEKLVQIDDRDYRLAVSQAEAQVAQARVRLQQEEAEAALAQEEWKTLGDGEGSSLAMREPQMAQARAGLLAAEAALEKARLDLERTSVRAQFDGRVRRKMVDLGQFVNRGTTLANIYSTDTAELRLPIPKDQLAYLDLGADLRLTGPDGLGPEVLIRGEIGNQTYSWRGNIVRAGSEFDPRTRMLPLFAQFDDPLRRANGATGPPLPMGLFVRAEISGLTAYDVVILPRSALRSNNEVLVVDPENRLRFRAVEVLRTDRDLVLVQSGLENGELVCVSPLESVVDGMEVRTQLEAGLLETDAEKEEQL